MPELAISTWSLHRTLGPVYPALDAHTGVRAAETPYGDGVLKLLDVPAYVAEMGIHALEICHFHFPRTDAGYLAHLRRTLDAAGVRLMTLLVDAGDIAAADVGARERDIHRIEGWIDVAQRVGATRVRVVAGTTPPDTAGRAVHASISGLTALVTYARARGVEIITENWLALAARPEQLLAILDETAYLTLAGAIRRAPERFPVCQQPSQGGILRYDPNISFAQLHLLPDSAGRLLAAPCSL